MDQKIKSGAEPLREITERMLEVFCSGGGIVDDCGCGITHVFTYGNNGNFNDGELESYEAKAKVNPEKYAFHAYSSSSAGYVAGNKFVMDCSCLEKRFGRYADFLWDNRTEIIDFIKVENAVRKESVSATESALKQANI